MNPFHDYTLRWWQVSLLKICLLAFGLAVGSTWPGLFAGWVAVLWAVFIVIALYFYYVMFKEGWLTGRAKSEG